MGLWYYKHMEILTNNTEKTPDKLIAIITQLQNQLQEKESAIDKKQLLISRQDARIDILEYRLQVALRHRYCARRETLDADHPQMHLFDEADLPSVTPEDEAMPQDTVTVASHTRVRRGRKPLPEDLPRMRREYDIDDSEKMCECGSELQLIGEDVSEQLEIIPAQMYVIAHVKKKYACKPCEGNVKSAKAPAQAIPKSIAGPGLLAHIMVSKYCDHLPLYRQEKILARIGIIISRASLCRWMIRCGELVAPLIKLMQSDIHSYDVAYGDETT